MISVFKKVTGLLFLITALAAVAVSFAGCGGGGGGGGGATATLTGTLTSSTSGVHFSSYTVSFDQKVNATPGSNGTFTLTFPASDITGDDAIYVYDYTGTLAGYLSVTPISGQTVKVGNITIGPPPPPPV